MKTKIISYIVWILLISNLFYSEFFGLNALVSAAASVIITAAFNPEILKKPKWWFTSSIWLIASVAVFLNGGLIHGFVFFISFLFFYAVSNNHKLSIPFGIMQSVQSFATGFYYYFDAIANGISRQNEKKSNKALINFLLIVGSFIVLLIFLKLYQAADPTFAKWTEFLNFEWISWGFIAFTILMSIMLYGLFFYRRDSSLDGWEDSLKNEIPETYSDKIQKFFGSKTEFKAAIGLLIPLNLMLLLLNFIDVSYIFDGLYRADRSLTYSEMVHDGVNSLIFSIVLVILLLTFLFRGNLNFTKSKVSKALAIFWLFQNLIMVMTISVKNYEYIAHWGLTYKRIGVYIWLLLAVIGLLLTIIKITRAQSFWFLLRNGSVAFTFVFTVLLIPSWNRTIADFNLTNLPPENIDIEYLVDLGPDTHPAIVNYYVAGNEVDRTDLNTIALSARTYINRFENKKNRSTWRSLVWNDEVLYKEFKNINFNFEITEERGYWD